MNLFQTLINKFKKTAKPELSLENKTDDYVPIPTVKYSPQETSQEFSTSMIQRKKHATKFNPIQQDQIVRMIARYENAKVIEKWAAEQGIEVSVKDLRYDYSKNEHWRPVIEKYRKQFLAEISDIPIASKIKRLHELSDAFERVREKEDSIENLKDKLECIEKEAMLLSKAQGELEGKVPVEQTNYYITQFNNMTREERDRYKQNLVEKLRGRIPLDQTIEVKPIEQITNAGSS